MMCRQWSSPLSGSSSSSLVYLEERAGVGTAATRLCAFVCARAVARPAFTKEEEEEVLLLLLIELGAAVEMVLLELGGAAV